MFGGILSLIAVTGKPSFLMKYRVQDDKPVSANTHKFYLVMVRAGATWWIGVDMYTPFFKDRFSYFIQNWIKNIRGCRFSSLGSKPFFHFDGQLRFFFKS